MEGVRSQRLNEKSELGSPTLLPFRPPGRPSHQSRSATPSATQTKSSLPPHRFPQCPPPLLPDDVLAEIVALLAPPSHVSVALSFPCLLSDVLDRSISGPTEPKRTSQTLPTHRIGLTSASRFLSVPTHRELIRPKLLFSLPCPSLVLSDRAFYSYLTIESTETCISLAQELRAWSKQNLPIPSFVVCPTFAGDTQLGSDETSRKWNLCPSSFVASSTSPTSTSVAKLRPRRLFS